MSTRLDAVGPPVLELWSRAHRRAGLRGAELGDGGVQQVDGVVKVDLGEGGEGDGSERGRERRREASAGSAQVFAAAAGRTTGKPTSLQGSHETSGEAAEREPYRQTGASNEEPASGRPFPLPLPLTMLTAIHSLRSSPGGSLTASRRSPEPSVAWMCCLSCSPFFVRSGRTARGGRWAERWGGGGGARGRGQRRGDRCRNAEGDRARREAVGSPARVGPTTPSSPCWRARTWHSSWA